MAGTKLQLWLVHAKRLIRADFLGAHNCDMSLHQKLFTIREHQVKCIPVCAKATRTKLKLARRVEVSPQTEVIVNYKATHLSIKNFGTPYAVAQPGNNSWQYAEGGLVIRSSLTAPNSGMRYLPVMNLSDALPPY